MRTGEGVRLALVSLTYLSWRHRKLVLSVVGAALLALVLLIKRR